MSSDDGTSEIQAGSEAPPGAMRSGEAELTDPGGLGQLPNDPGGLTEAEEDRRSVLCKAAVRYAGFGWAVIPVYGVTDDDICQCPRGADCNSPGKHPVHWDWPEKGTASEADAAWWWRPTPPEGYIAEDWWPRANIGIVTGRRSDIFVLDVDPDNGGDESLARLEAKYGPLPLTRRHVTGSGGLHYFFRHPGFDVRNSANKLLAEALGINLRKGEKTGLDLRGEKGQIVAPPSRSAKGQYLITPAGDQPIADAPDWLIELLRKHDTSQKGQSLSGVDPGRGTGYARRYGEAAIRSVCEDLVGAAEGHRNNMLNECAFRLGTLGGAGIVSEEDAWKALYDTAMSIGLGEGETRKTFLSGWRKGLERPREVQWHLDGMEWPTRPWTEFGNADRMVDHWGDTLRWCPERNTWMVYTQGVWSGDSREAGQWHAQMMLRNLEVTEAHSYDDAPDPDDKDFLSPQEKFLHWVYSQHSRKAVTSAADLSRGLPVMRISQRSFDPYPTYLNTRSCVADLGTGEVIEHDPEQRMTMQCQVEFDLEASADRWEAFLAEVQPDKEMRSYLQRVIGYSATALMIEQVIFLHHGTGANGKSVFHAVISHVLGTYAQTVPVETLLATQLDGQVPNDIARMAGRRYLQASETKAGKSLDEQRIKQLTGGDSVSARFMRGEFFEFTPVGKIHLTSNHLPHLSDDDATWRRVQLVSWPVEIPEHRRDGFLTEKLIREESAGVLAWIVRGAMAWQERRLDPPESALAAKKAYREEEDFIGQFIADCLDIDQPELFQAMGRSAGEIFAQYQYWAKSRGYAPGSQRGLTEKLQKKGLKYVKSHNWRGFPTTQVRWVAGT